MNIKIKFRFFIILTLLIIDIMSCFTFAKGEHTQDERNNVLILCKIIDDDKNMDFPVKRKDFAEMIIKSSKYKDKSGNYIKTAVDNNYMFYYLGGDFKENENTTYNDVARACLSLLGYTNDDFKGNQVKGRILKFISLGLDEFIDKKPNDFLTKKDIVNVIYNTLKENVKDTNLCYGMTVFDKLLLDSDGELNADEIIEKKIEGPYYIKKNIDLNISFDINNDNVYLNGKRANIDDVMYDVGCYGYVIYYIDNINKVIYAYSERVDVDSPVSIRRGYVYDIEYNADNMLIPSRVIFNNQYYYLENEEMKYAFSANGKIKIDDEIAALCSKIDYAVNTYINPQSGKVQKISDTDSKVYDGYIISAVKIKDIFGS